MKKLLPVIALFVAVYIGWGQFDRPNDSAGLTGQSDKAAAFDERKSSVQTEGNGIVIKMLPDDNGGSRHQRFMLRLHSGQTVLLAHNIDLAPRLSSRPLRDLSVFNRVQLDVEVHTLVWPNGADFDPATLHDWPEQAHELTQRARRWDLTHA